MGDMKATLDLIPRTEEYDLAFFAKQTNSADGLPDDNGKAWAVSRVNLSRQDSISLGLLMADQALAFMNKAAAMMDPKGFSAYVKNLVILQSRVAQAITKANQDASDRLDWH